VITSAFGALAFAVAAAGAAAARPPARAAAPRVRHYPTARAAVAAALAEQPRAPVVIGFGELHQTRGTAGVESALRRFTREILPALAGSSSTSASGSARTPEGATELDGRLSHLVVETWVSRGGCGDAEKRVTEDVERTTERPATTGNEIVTLIEDAARLRVSPKVLEVSCADYRSLQAAAGGGLDYDRVLRMTARALERSAGAALRARAKAAARTGDRSGDKTGAGAGAVAIYGGALHNDLHPERGLESYSYVPAVAAAVLGRYLEIDVIVPEYAETSGLAKAESWYAIYRRARDQDAGATTPDPRAVVLDPRAVVLIDRSPRSFVLVFPSAGRAAP
jgi:hypothetical protein